MLNQPNDSEQLKLLFEKNTIRKSSKTKAPTSLSLPDPINGSSKSLFAQQEPTRPERSVLIPFKSPKTTLKAEEEETLPSNSSHKIAQLKRLYALEQASQENETTRETVPHDDVKEIETPPEFMSKLRRTEARLQLAQTMLHMEESLEACLKNAAQLVCERFSLWRIRIFVTNTNYPLLRDLRVQHNEAQRNLPDMEQSLKVLLRTGKESHEQAQTFHRWSLPIKYRQQILGAIEILHSPAFQLSADDSITLRSLSDDLAEYLTAFIAESKQDAMRPTDPLTGFLNYSSFLNLLDQELSSPLKTHVTLMRVDPDYFSQINEVHGYQQGDQVLQQIAVLLDGLVPIDCLKARLHGASFVLLFKNKSLSESQTIAEQIRQAVACLRVEGKYKASLGITVSIGIAHHPRGEQIKSPEALIEAETALTRAQEQGKNQTQLYEEQSYSASHNTDSERPEKKEALPSHKPAVAARKWSDILQQELEKIQTEWHAQTEDYGVSEVQQAVLNMDIQLPRLLNSLCALLDQKSTLDELAKMPLSYFIPSKIVAEIRRGNPEHQLISYEVAFMLLQESLLEIFGSREDALQPAIDSFFTCINDKLSQLKSDLQKGI